MRLSTKFQVVILAVVGLAIVSSGVALVSAWHVAAKMRQATGRQLPAIRAAEELEIALLEQKEWASFYAKDGDPKWLDKIRQKKQEFQDWLAQARQTTLDSGDLAILDRLDVVYRNYDRLRSDAIGLARRGQSAQAAAILDRQVTPLHGQAYDLCERYIDSNQANVDAASAAADRQVGRVTLLVTICSLLTIVMGAALAWLFFRNVLFPLRQMVADARQFTQSESQPIGPPGDELRAMGSYLAMLMADVVDKRSALEDSRQRMLSAEKLATVGKLAASVAHEIRNPLTSIKMWLYSLDKAVGRDAGAKRKLDIIAEELQRLEGIVHHFLEFARPPQLKRRPQDLPTLVQRTLELFHHQAEAKKVELSGPAAAALPPVMVDCEQVRQVLINLLTNATDATPAGGRISLEAAAQAGADGRPMVVLRVRDSGSGMPPEIRRRIFEPFFTTKDDGTGLGLCIAARIMAEHGGRLTLESTSEQGTTFALWLPIATETPHGQDPGC